MNKKILSIVVLISLILPISSFAEYTLNDNEIKKIEKTALIINKKSAIYRKKIRAYFKKLLELTNDPLTITIINDKRCTNCMTEQIINQIKQSPFGNSAKFINKDFSDNGIDKYLKDNDIKNLPAIIFSTNELNDKSIGDYLKLLKDNQYSLEVGANFDPYIKRSARGFLTVEKDILKKIKENSYVKGNKDAKITWLEFSDLECPYCAKLHNSGTLEKIIEKYGNKLNIIFNHFPLQFHANAMPAARIAECLAKETSSDKFYELLKIAYSLEKSEKDFLIGESVKLGANKDTIEKCADSDEFDKKINDEQTLGSSTFGVTGTPGNVLINNETGEYEVLSGAYPYENFETIIDKLLK